MDREQGKNHDLTAKFSQISAEINQLAQQNQNDVCFLLALLRNLEQIHRQIRTSMFEASLPSSRNKLYDLIKDIEEQGGWPYIERMKLQQLLKNIELDSTKNSTDD